MAAWNVCKGHVNRSWHPDWLNPLEVQWERDISPTVTHLLVKRLVATLEMNDRGGICASDTSNICG